MKKLFAILTVLVMMLSAVAVADAAELTGEWYLVEVRMGEAAVNPAGMGMELTMELKDDNTMQMTTKYGDSEPEVVDGTWAATETGIDLTSAGETQSLTLEEGNLVIAMEEGAMVFGREAAPVAADLPATVLADSEEAFFGNWKLNVVSVMGMVMPAELMEMEMTMTVEAGKVILTSDGESKEAAGEFADGVLVVTMDGESMKLEKTEDEGIVMNLEEDGVTMGMYFVKAE